MSAIEVRLFAPSSNKPLLLGSLTDPREHGIEGISGDETRQLDVQQFPRSEHVVVFDRQNRVQNLTLRVSRLHESLADSLLYWLKHPSTVPNLAAAQFTQDGAIAWLNGCGIQSVRRSQRIGVTTIFEYQLVGGSWSNSRDINL